MEANSGLLWQCPPVIDNVFQYLCAKDLSNCAKVCSLWHSMTITENNRRRFVEWFLEVGIGESTDMDGNLVSAPLPPGVLYPFQEKIASVRAHPSCCLAFVTLETLEHISETFPIVGGTSVTPKKKKQRLDCRNYLKGLVDCSLKPLLPVQCQIHCIASSGIIGCHNNLSPAEVEKGRSISGLLLPHFPGVSISYYTLEHLHQIAMMGKPTQPIKCLLMFGSMSSVRLVQSFINQCCNRNGNSEFAVGGGIVKVVSEGFGSCFCFSGENIEAASVVIDKTMTDVGLELAQFKKTGLLENQCFAFMFTCVAKGFLRYSVSNFESSIFRNMYPDVPLTGIFGHGEIGVHHLPNVDKEDPDNKQRSKKFSHKKCIRAYNSVFVLLSVKTPK